MADGNGAPERLVLFLESRYRIERKLGVGETGTVYLADDLRHHRKVALRVVSEHLTATVGATQVLRQIEHAAQLQHPNILPLLDSGEFSGIVYHVTPYVEGQSLRERLAEGNAIPVRDVIRILVEIVDALASAHTNNVVHLDLTPENVMLSGRHALLMDFGLAKASETANVFGTAAYLAPEQVARDPHVDHRADIYAVGVIAHELLAGRLTPALDQTLLKCLAVHPADRWQTAEELLASLESPAISGESSAVRTTAWSNRIAGWPTYVAIAAVIVVVALAGAAALRGRNQGPGLTMGRAVQFTSEPELELFPAISPDGKMVAYSAGNSAQMRIYLRPVGGGRTVELSNDRSAVETQPRWSPDGEKILFLSHGSAYVAMSSGGDAHPVIPGTAHAAVVAAMWSPDGHEIAVVRGDSLLVFAVDGSGGTFIARGVEWHSCTWSPMQTWIACVAGNLSYVQPGALFGNRGQSAIVVIATSGGQVSLVTDSASFNQSPQWNADGSRLLFVSNRDRLNDIFAVPIGAKGRLNGSPVRITTGLGVQSFSIDAANKHLAYAVYQDRANVWSLPIPGSPPVSIEGATQITSGSQVVETMRVSSDDRWVIYDSDLGGNSDIYRVPTGGGEPKRLTSDPANDFAADLSPDGRELAFHSFRKGTRDIFVQAMSGGPARAVVATQDQEGSPAWSPDGNALAYADYSSGGILVVRRDSKGVWGKPVRRSAGGLDHAWSPDGTMLAVASGSTIRGMQNGERLELIPPILGDARTLYTVVDKVSDPVVGEPHWSRDGKGVYFKSQDVQARASLWFQPLTGGRPRQIVSFTDVSRPSFRGSFAADSKRFYFAINERRSDIWIAEVTTR